MYTWRRMSEDEREAILAARRFAGLPLHEPPHFPTGRNVYLLTAANYEHAPVMQTEQRRAQLERELLEGLATLSEACAFGWVVLPNHYHLLAEVDLAEFRLSVGRSHNRTATRWNREDGTPGRRVWHRFVDRSIRNQRHFWAAVNHVHANPVKHGHVCRAEEWPCSSVHAYLAELGRDGLAAVESEFPALNLGRGWDW